MSRLSTSRYDHLNIVVKDDSIDLCDDQERDELMKKPPKGKGGTPKNMQLGAMPMMPESISLPKKKAKKAKAPKAPKGY